jgi:hypothetical protein
MDWLKRAVIMMGEGKHSFHEQGFAMGGGGISLKPRNGYAACGAEMK